MQFRTFLWFLFFIVFSFNILNAQQDTTQALKPDFKDWQVEYPYGPADSVSFTVSTGTWMNLDISPDGKEIVFDLLGDIYLLPITGGKAKLLSGGLAYEVQPRFSPDGSRISFTSDAGGGDNIWTMNRDGSDKKQVTKENFRLLNNAVWTPDGEYLIARKHFTSQRSLGAGEMWMYHHTGGEGIRLTKRKNDQQDAGEPCISPDGRYLYYSEDMSGGSTFQYNKDPNGQIYVIRRLDLETGKLENYISVQGGAVRPQVSPDGKLISFVRRVRSKSVLYIYNTETGEMHPLYDQLSRDQQETWAIFGVYPNYNWTPDGKSIIIWAKGKLVRIDTNTGNATAIPFEVESRQIVSKAVHFQQTAFQPEFSPKMIRHVRTSPDGKWIVFNAVGYLWKKRLPDGKPERLTNDSGWFEFYPAFSPDGIWVTYVTWNDTALGAIRKVRLRGGKSIRLTAEKGHYYTPSYSPDGTMIVYRKASGNYIRGYYYAVNPGIYWIAADGENQYGNFVTEDGEYPRFNAESDRIYIFVDGSDKHLKSVNLAGFDERSHFTSKYATDVVISPDEKWVAFQELFNIYITPFPKTGNAINLSSSSKSIPLKKVTRDAGTSLHWSGDSQTLHWVTGSDYFSKDLRNTFEFVPGAPDSLSAIDSTGVPINLVVEADVPKSAIALTNARIITMKRDEVIEKGTIVIRSNRIESIGNSSDISIPSDVKTIDLSGKTIIPGLIDVHAHAGHFTNDLTTQQHWPYFANLAYGVTTIHDPSATTEIVFSQSELVKTGGMIGPRVFSTGTILYGAEGDFKAVINNIDDARSHLRRMKAVGAFSVKSYNQPRRNQRQQIIQAARELKMHVYPEGGSTFFHNMSMILDGHTGIEHNIPIAPIYDDVKQLWSNSQTGYTPTLVVSYGTQSGERYWYQHSNVWEKQRLLKYTPRAIIDSRSRRRDMSPDDEYGHFDHARDLKALTNLGVKVNLGAHGQLQGLGAHWEMWMFAQGGMTPMEVIRAATLNGAHYLGMDHELGSLEVGKLADLVVLDRNPLENIRNTEFVRYVMVNGHLYDVETMNEIFTGSFKRMPFYWELPGVNDSMIWQPGKGIDIPGCGCPASHK
jgi:imidazolonepropionase-like amidohydrolase/Tol biopolymer transport system component